ncbi:MAG: SPOR domain-containing protein [Desulfarculaceae bacterium]|jgi:cell division septation protein DedD
MPYSICAASFADQKAARAHAAKLGKKGIKAWVAAVDLKKKGRWYRVYVGRYASFDQARQQLAQMRTKGLGTSPFVTRVP